MPRGNPGIPRIKLDVEKMRQLFQQPLTQKEIAKELAISYGSLRKWAPQFGLKRTMAEAVQIPYRSGRRLRPKASKLQNRGYVYVLSPDHPRANSAGYAPEHILIWERTHNKPLPEGWVVHHLNGIKMDNRPSNLRGMPKRQHHGKLIEQAIKQRVRELEVEVGLLTQALENGQMIFHIGEN